jgi:UPF0755 protein
LRLSAKRVLQVLAVLLVVLLIAAGVAARWLWRSVHEAAQQPGVSATAKELDVAPGTSLRSVLHNLEQQQLIRNARYLEWYLRCCQNGTAVTGAGIKAGHYRIAPGQPPLDILQQLVEGRVVLEQVTFVEGWNFAQMRAVLAKQRGVHQTLTGMSDAQIMQALDAPDLRPEGRFAPDTYAFAPGAATDLQILRMAFEAQQRTLQQAWDTRQPDLPLATPTEALTLASMVEKETGLASERARVAGVYIHRLRIGMRLQSDPTVIYGIGDRYDGNIRKHDLVTDNPYNTYTRAGLPPTPIAMPGRDAIIATLNPEKTDALFFVAVGDGSGGHYFSATMAEHGRAVRRYLERLHNASLEAAAESTATTTPQSATNAAPAP